MTTPFFFGEGQRRLLGVYEPAERRAGATPRAAVFCAPWGPDYCVAHGALRRLASNMSAAGHHVLRFDYFGVGESAGASEEGDLEGWRDDIETAVEELKSMAGTPRVSLVGLRLGGTLAAEVATRRGDIEALALWDPVVSGRGYLDELDAEHAAWLAERTRYVPFPPTDVPNRVCHAFPRNLESQVAAIDLKALAPKLRQKVLLVITESLRTHEAFMAAFPLATRSRMTVERVTDRPPWRLDTMGFGGPLPRDALKRIVEWIG